MTREPTKSDRECDRSILAISPRTEAAYAILWRYAVDPHDIEREFRAQLPQKDELK